MGIFSRNKKNSAPAADQHTHAPAAEPPVQKRPDAVKKAVGIGATKFLVRPLVTEKSALAQKHDTYTFVVQPRASKRAVKEAVEKVYGVRVIQVRTSRYDGKKVRSGRINGTRSAFKKAFVTVAKGQTISFA